MNRNLFFVLLSVLLPLSVSSACQIVCSRGESGVDLILCDPGPDNFETIFWYTDEKGKSDSVNLSENLRCSIDEQDGRVTRCQRPGAPEHQFRSRTIAIREMGEGEGKTKANETSILEVTIHSPRISELKGTVLGREGDQLKLQFPLKNCSAKSTEERKRGRRKGN